MGPTRDGRIKPDITAPGAAIAVARPFNRNVDSMGDPDNYHRMVFGTSFAAPHVAGAIALMLQLNHYLSPNQIRTILIKDARQDRFTGNIDKQTGSTLWGWGKLNALNSTLDAPSVYAVRMEIDPLGLPLRTNLTLDGQNIREVSLNKTPPIILEFRDGGNHTVTPSRIIQIDPRTRYELAEEPWTFSAGGVRRFHYQLQFFLQVKSALSYPTGTGWYSANSTAVASVVPPAAEGYEFLGWIGSVISDSPTVQVKMDSGKEVVAVWRPVKSPLNISNIVGIALAIAISLIVALVIRYKRPKRTYAKLRVGQLL
jgi:subtilase family serine protease